MRINLTKKDLINQIYMQLGFSKLVSENKSSLPNESLNQDSADLDDEIPF